jgi:hypothetical protein
MDDEPLPIEFTDDRSPEAKAFLSAFETFVTEQYGERHETRACGCCGCQMWALYDLTNLMVA